VDGAETLSDTRRYDNTAESPDNHQHHLSRHMASLKPSRGADRSGAFNVSESLSYLTQVKGVNASDINLGISLYGRGYYGCDHPGASYSTLDGDWQRTLWDAKDLPPVGSSERWDEDSQAAWSFDPEQRLVVSYENGRSIAAKSSYIQNEAKLGGVCFWDVTADKAGANSLIRQVSFLF
jgi:chitinase